MHHVDATTTSLQRLGALGLDLDTLDEEFSVSIDHAGTVHTRPRHLYHPNTDTPLDLSHCAAYAPGLSRSPQQFTLSQIIVHPLCDCAEITLARGNLLTVANSYATMLDPVIAIDELQSPSDLGRQLGRITQNLYTISDPSAHPPALSTLRQHVIRALSEYHTSLLTKLRSPEVAVQTERQLLAALAESDQPTTAEHPVLFTLTHDQPCDSDLGEAVIATYCRYRKHPDDLFLVAPYYCYHYLFITGCGSAISNPVELTTPPSNALIEATAVLWEKFPTGPLHNLANVLAAAQSCF